MTRTLLAAACAFTLGVAWATPALADEPTYEFGFADDTTTLPPSVSPAEVLTIGVKRVGDDRKGVILLVGGKAIYFESVDSEPLQTRAVTPDAFTTLGK